MVALAAWYDSDDDEPITISATDELDALLDRMTADAMNWVVPPLVEVSRHDANGWAIAYIGVNARMDLGVITHSDATGSVISFNGISTAEPVNYDYMGHLREIPGTAEVSLTDIRKAAHEFVATNGARPTHVRWQVDE